MRKERSDKGLPRPGSGNKNATGKIGNKGNVNATGRVKTGNVMVKPFSAQRAIVEKIYEEFPDLPHDDLRPAVKLILKRYFNMN